MESILKPAKAFFKAEPISIDNAVFKLHYRVTFLVLVTASLYVYSNMYKTSPILCSHGYLTNNFATKIEDQFCLTHSTHSSYGSTEKVHFEYQWVATVLFLQALTFYFPRFAFKRFENGRTAIIIQNLNHPLLLENERKSQILNITNYWKNYRGTHFSLALTFLVCEILNLLIVTAQIIITNLFLGGHFFTIGINLLQINIDPKIFPIEQIFPNVAKCTLSSYDPSGFLNKSDLYCILPQNIVHKYVYIALWFWYIILSVVTSIHTILQILSFFCPTIKIFLIGKMTKCSKKKLFSVCKVKEQKYHQNIGDTFMIQQVLKNINNKDIKTEIIDSLSQIITTKDV